MRVMSCNAAFPYISLAKKSPLVSFVVPTLIHPLCGDPKTLSIKESSLETL